jgi:hypothetical protein
MAQQVGSMLWQAAANAASVAGMGGSSMAGGDGVACEGCSRSVEDPVITPVLMSLLGLYPGLRKLEVYTKVWCFGNGQVMSWLMTHAGTGLAVCGGCLQKGKAGFAVHLQQWLSK